MAYVQFYGNLPSSFRLKDLFVAPASAISLTQDLDPDIASFSIRTSKGTVPVTYYGTSLSLTEGSVSAITFGAPDKPWVIFGSASDSVTRFTYAGGLAAFHRNGSVAAAAVMSGNDSLRGSANGDYLEGYAGNDVLNGAAGADTMVGGTGDDTYYVDNQRDRVVEYYRGGRDTVIASTHYTLPEDMYVEVLQARAGTSKLTLTGNKLANHIIGNDGANVLIGGGGTDTLEGGGGDDTYVVAGANVRIVEAANGGIDTVLASASYTLTGGSAVENLKATGSRAVTLVGNSAANTISGNDAANLIKGGGGNDTVYGGGGHDSLYGGDGNDVLYGGDGVDRLYGQDGNDTLYGGPGNGLLFGGNGNDVLYGSWNDDLLSGDAGDDKLFGDTGNDTIKGGDGNDKLSGGEGYDCFVFDTPLLPGNVDTITDFNPWADQIRLSRTVFTDIGPKGALSADRFWTGTKAHDESDRIIYNKGTGVLSYDPDGTGPQQQIKFAIVGKLDLSEAAFLII